MTHSQSEKLGASLMFSSWSGCFSMVLKGPLSVTVSPRWLTDAQPISVKDKIISIVFMIFSLVHDQYGRLRKNSKIVFFNHKRAIDSGY